LDWKNWRVVLLWPGLTAVNYIDFQVSPLTAFIDGGVCFMQPPAVALLVAQVSIKLYVIFSCQIGQLEITAQIIFFLETNETKFHCQIKIKYKTQPSSVCFPWTEFAFCKIS